MNSNNITHSTVPAVSEPLLTAKELADQWRVSLYTILRLCRERELTHTKIRGQVFISVSAAKAYLKKQTTIA